MKLPLPLKSNKSLRIGGLILAGALHALACGPDFPNSYLQLPARSILAAPEGFFAVEVARLSPDVSSRIIRDDSKEDTRESDDLRCALTHRGAPNDQIERVVQAHQAFRFKQRQLSREKRAAKSPAIPEGLPSEFACYLAGATAWYEGDTEAARTKWRQLLALPEAERHYRSTWAAYMLARSFGDEFPPSAEARRWFAETRVLARAGFADSINLAGASDGIEAHWAMALQDYSRAICLYLDQYATGDETAYASLRMVAAAAAACDEKEKRAIAREPRARRLLTAWFLAGFKPGYEGEPDQTALRTWTTALSKEGIRDCEHADRLAWLAYEAGDFDLAQTWAGMALDASPETHWIRAKLALYDNRLCEGAAELDRAAASPGLAAIYRSVVLGELGRVQLALDRREAALAAWLDGGHWEDAAYVAERLLTIDELKAFLASYRPGSLPSYEPHWGEAVTPETLASEAGEASGAGVEPDPTLQVRLSDLLARRLVRAGRVDEAGKYFCARMRPVLSRYVDDVRMGFDTTLAPRKRARAFWRAAQVAHDQGMALMGAELEPDFSIWEGSFAFAGIAEERAKPEAGMFAASKDEAERLAKTAMPARRFSYRYRAADLAWWAAALLPNDGEETAFILTTAGGWLKSRDPEGANRFYQALVIRCGSTQRGIAAAARHWFPPDN